MEETVETILSTEYENHGQEIWCIIVEETVRSPLRTQRNLAQVLLPGSPELKKDDAQINHMLGDSNDI